jgi:hypothetical protein
MIETSTNTYSQNRKIATEVQYKDSIEGMEVDDLIFYSSISAELDQIDCNPKAETIRFILNYSQELS